MQRTSTTAIVSLLLALAFTCAGCGPQYATMRENEAALLAGSWATPPSHAPQRILTIDDDRVQYLIGQAPGPMFPMRFSRAFYYGRVLILTNGSESATALVHYKVDGEEYLLDSAMHVLVAGEAEPTREILERHGLKKSGTED